MKPTNIITTTPTSLPGIADSDSGTESKSTNIFYNPTFRSIVFQAIAILGLGYFFYAIINNALNNLDARGIATGFDFLSQEAGFGISMSLIDYNETFSYGRTFVVGLLNTALVSFLGIIFASALGFTIGVARLSSNWLVNRMAAVYIETFRSIPLLLQIFFWYFAVLQVLPSPRQSISLGEAVFLNVRGLYFPAPIFEPGSELFLGTFIFGLVLSVIVFLWAKDKQERTGEQTPTLRIALGLCIGVPGIVFLFSGMPVSADLPALKGFNFRGGVSVIPELAALWIALSIYTASFIAEIVRSGINSVSHGQTEAALSLGLPTAKTLKLIIIPQAMRVIIPPLTSQFLNLTKNSSLAMAIGYPDLVSVFAGTTLNQTGQAIEIIAMTMAVYLALSLITSVLMNLYNNKVSLVER